MSGLIYLGMNMVKTCVDELKIKAKLFVTNIRSTMSKLQMAFNTCHGIVDFVFHCGYQGLSLPKWFRKAFAKQVIHKAWVSGFYGGGILSILDRHVNKDDFTAHYDKPSIGKK
jgi:hypothetical protein